MNSSLPYISIIIPFHNEEGFIQKCLDSVLQSDYPSELTEILLVDGMSTDKSAEIIKKYQSKNYNIFLLKNEKKIFPAAVNLGYKHAKGEIIFILGAHAIYSSDYFSKSVNYSLQLNADNVGGVLQTVGLNQSIIGKSITYVLSSSFGVGNATFRTGAAKVIEVDTVFGGCYKRSVFEKIGLFNENLVSSSDMDFNVRLKKSGGKIWLAPDIKATYFTRTNFVKFIKNNFRNGYWAIYPMRFVDYIPVSFRHFVPLGFFLSVIVGSILSFFSYYFFVAFIGVLSLYFFIGFLFSLKYFTKNPLNIIVLPCMFFLLHMTYGFGSLIAMVKVFFKF